jgi:hypothetical protein
MAPSFSTAAKDPLQVVVHDIVGSSAMRANPFLDHRVVTRIANQSATNGSTIADPLVLMAASLCIIQERYHVT